MLCLIIKLTATGPASTALLILTSSFGDQEIQLHTCDVLLI